MKKSAIYSIVLERFEKNNPLPETELFYGNPYELVVAVILSAQCTDVRVNLITPEFFKRFPDENILGAASQEEVFEYIKSCSYPNNKAKNLIGMAQSLRDHYKGIVPDTVEELVKIPGIGRKTANVIASVIYNKPTMAVDTHVFRVAERIGLTTKAKNPYQSEMQLIEHIPEEKIPAAHHWLILHGRYVCKARKPECEKCFLNDVCRYRIKNLRRDVKS